MHPLNEIDGHRCTLNGFIKKYNFDLEVKLLILAQVR
jgi:hypothetical protein